MREEGRIRVRDGDRPLFFFFFFFFFLLVHIRTPPPPPPPPPLWVVLFLYCELLKILRKWWYCWSNLAKSGAFRVQFGLNAVQYVCYLGKSLWVCCCLSRLNRTFKFLKNWVKWPKTRRKWWFCWSDSAKRCVFWVPFGVHALQYVYSLEGNHWGSLLIFKGHRVFKIFFFIKFWLEPKFFYENWLVADRSILT